MLVSVEVDYIELPPSPDLAHLVTRFWYLRTPSPPPFERIVPMPFVHIIVNLSSTYRVVRRGTEPAGVSFASASASASVSGLQSSYLVNENPELIEHVGAELQPYGLRPFTTFEPSAITDRVLPADAVLPGIEALRDRIGRDPLPVEAVTVLESALRSRLRATAPHPAVVAAVRLIAEDPDRPIAELARLCEVSHTTLSAQFKRHCGVTPKTYSDVYRFHKFLGAVPRQGSMPTWTELLARAGYYDQPHFIRTFFRFTGMTPRAYYDAVKEFGLDYPSFVAQGDEG